MKVGTGVKWLLVGALSLVLGMEGALARDHGRPHIGVVIGPMWPPYYVPRPLYYYPPYMPVVIEPPPVYIEQIPPVTMAPPAPEPIRYWYYCAGPRAYYPYVNECPGGWMKVLPQVPPQ